MTRGLVVLAIPLVVLAALVVVIARDWPRDDERWWWV